jgi:hypothetical protein
MTENTGHDQTTGTGTETELGGGTQADQTQSQATAGGGTADMIPRSRLADEAKKARAAAKQSRELQAKLDAYEAEKREAEAGRLAEDGKLQELLTLRDQEIAGLKELNDRQSAAIKREKLRGIMTSLPGGGVRDPLVADMVDIAGIGDDVESLTAAAMSFKESHSPLFLGEAESGGAGQKAPEAPAQIRGIPSGRAQSMGSEPSDQELASIEMSREEWRLYSSGNAVGDHIAGAKKLKKSGNIPPSGHISGI